MGKKETWACRPAPGGKDAVENGLGHHYSETLSFRRACFAHPFFPDHPAHSHLALVPCGREDNPLFGQGRGWLASPPRDSWTSHHLCVGRKRNRGALEPSGAEEDQAGVCYIAQSKGEEKNTGMLAQ